MTVQAYNNRQKKDKQKTCSPGGTAEEGTAENGSVVGYSHSRTEFTYSTVGYCRVVHSSVMTFCRSSMLTMKSLPWSRWTSSLPAHRRRAPTEERICHRPPPEVSSRWIYAKFFHVRYNCFSIVPRFIFTSSKFIFIFLFEFSGPSTISPQICNKSSVNSLQSLCFKTLFI